MPLVDNIDHLGKRVGDEFVTLRTEIPPILIQGSGRFYLNGGREWSTNSDDNYGPNYYNFSETCGTGSYPNVEWEHIGHFIPAGRTVSRLHFTGRASGSDISDLEVFACLRRPNDFNKWKIGYDSDSDQTIIPIIHDTFAQPSNQGLYSLSGDAADMHYQRYDVDPSVGIVEEPSFLSLYVRSYGNWYTRYFYANYTWELV